MSAIDRSLVENAVDSQRLRPDGIYTSPRSYGVYLILGPGVGKRHRFGNHPVREKELLREYGACEVIALFLDRDDAAQLARHLNR